MKTMLVILTLLCAAPALADGVPADCSKACACGGTRDPNHADNCTCNGPEDRLGHCLAKKGAKRKAPKGPTK